MASLARSTGLLRGGHVSAPLLNFVRRLGGLSLDSMNQNVLNAQYAVRGAIVLRGMELAAQLKDPVASKELPFDSIIACNIGNPQALRQAPLTFNREVLALCLLRHKLDDPEFVKDFAPDVVERAKKYMNAVPEGMGAYSESKGFPVVRQEVADFIEARDGVSADINNIFITDGASKGVDMMLKMLISSPDDGILVPIPQYPLYSATIALCNGHMVGYYLDEANDWALSVTELERALSEAKAKGINVKGLAVINPGNPTGNVMTASNIKSVLSFCHSNDLVMLADEVYQENIYGEVPFTSFKKVLAGMAIKDEVQMASFHSVSKGFLGECGVRGGYMEIQGFSEEVADQIYKLASIGLCSNTVGQLSVGLMVNPPKGTEASAVKYAKEKDAIMESLKRRAVKLVAAFNDMPGITCNATAGAMYAFPQISLPSGVTEAAEKKGMAADAYYALSLLEATGIVVVPGSGFGQVPGTFHFRTTFLPPEEMIDAVIARYSTFHSKFIQDHS